MTFSRSPRVLRGAFVQFDEQTPQGRVIVFQYNPERLCRRLEARTKEFCGWSGRNRIRTIKSPRETVTFTITLDATDNLEDADAHPDTVEAGIYPPLSAIEMLLYSQSSAQTRGGFLGIRWPTPAKKQPLTLFVWGDKRIVPVQVTELRINEEMFDPILNPVRANIEVTMRVLNDADLPRVHRGYEYWKSHLTTKIAMAQAAYTNTQVSNLITF